METVRVLHILNELRPSGAEVMLQVAAPFWAEIGIQGEVLATGTEVGPYAQTLAEAGYKIHHLPRSRSLGFALKVFRLLRQEKYDVVHVHPEQTNFWYAGLAWLARVRKIVRTVHSLFPNKGFLRLRRRVERTTMRKVFGVHMISISPAVEQLERENFGNETTLIPNWYDSSGITLGGATERARSRLQLGIPEHVCVVVTVGGCSVAKNHTALLHAIAQIGEETPIWYLHVGPEDPYLSERSLAENLGISSRVKFLGMQVDVRPALWASDLYVMPSQYEGFGIAAVEAMGAGRPVLLADVGGLRDLKKMCSGIIWTEPNAKAVERSLKEFLAMTDAERAELGIELHRTAVSSFGLERGPRAYAELYKPEASAAQ